MKRYYLVLSVLFIILLLSSCSKSDDINNQDEQSPIEDVKPTEGDIYLGYYVTYNCDGYESFKETWDYYLSTNEDYKYNYITDIKDYDFDGVTKVSYTFKGLCMEKKPSYIHKEPCPNLHNINVINTYYLTDNTYFVLDFNTSFYKLSTTNNLNIMLDESKNDYYIVNDDNGSSQKCVKVSFNSFNEQEMKDMMDTILNALKN